MDYAHVGEKNRQMSALSTRYVLGCEILPSKKKPVSIETYTVLKKVRERVRFFSTLPIEYQKYGIKEFLVEIGGLRSAFRNNMFSETNISTEETFL